MAESIDSPITEVNLSALGRPESEQKPPPWSMSMWCPRRPWITVSRSWNGAKGSMSKGSFSPLIGVRVVFVVSTSGRSTGCAARSWKPLSKSRNTTRLGGA